MPANHPKPVPLLQLCVQNEPLPAFSKTKTHLIRKGAAAEAAQCASQFRFRILVVDDESSLRELARQVLETRGYEVSTAADGLDALDALSKSLPDLIISDLNMPRMSGFEFLALVRERFPHIATIAVSGQCVAIGDASGLVADAFLQKGHYTVAQLCGWANTLLTARTRSQAAFCSAGRSRG